MEIIGKLFGSEAKAKIIRLFLFNQESVYSIRDVSSRTNVKGNQAMSAMKALFEMGFVRRKSISKEAKISGTKIHNKKSNTGKKKAKENVYFLDQKFPYVGILSDLMAAVSLKVDDRLTAKIMSAGKIKLVIASGIFLRHNDARIDLLIVGDDINENKLASIIKSLETDIGRDLSYSSLTTADFHYRLELHDRLIRDVMDFDHVILTDKIGFQTRK